jgi:hypothetical protein
MIEADLIDRIAGLLEAQGLSESAVVQLRGAFPDFHFTYCQDDDVAGPDPVRSEQGFNIYLVDGRNHCLCFTKDPQVATGLVLAEVEGEE